LGDAPGFSRWHHASLWERDGSLEERVVERRRRVSEEENKAIFRRYVEEVTNRGNLDLADEIFDRYLAHQPDGSVLERGSEHVKRFMGEFRSAFPNFHTTIEDQIAEGDKVMTRWRMSGTHRGEFRGIAPTGKKLDITGIGIFRFSSEGKVVESWDSFDQLGLMQQLGVIPAPDQPEEASPT
jgi:steroid delta-isomerase-like uncharacterized protein